ncbi:hypothetical protein [Mycoplasmopsis arginini]|uniref:hypothetical protein n=1 Tax=Mycoplasmopsis arginini TaxID=2094 RepID=UPI0016432B76
MVNPFLARFFKASTESLSAQITSTSISSIFNVNFILPVSSSLVVWLSSDGVVIVILGSSIVRVDVLFDLPQDVNEKINIKLNKNNIIFFIIIHS